ncbi:mitochondrial carrier protein, putative [Ichthyophthirius multifiliis]|uniref:Mitochondrial carrier protein, putative n=1 Tax=Ichthyophthirius multifiliis TaxID=5932 RepID=G0QRH0_ICHMU|nr:mitochondrial carrier protein, putative [Ichthyophthirius multifiliis]EGR32185.1 mitochondrial carrier protein, putative [Ichthyophthirius multifiliis]|eukprot:XP_004035671.1 mitochondrial carrier protein, putative [Ichthyophthirius multifiliis]
MVAAAQTGAPKKNPLKAIISGGLAGGIEIMITYPTEFVKTKMQLYPDLAKKGIMFCANDTIKKHGIIGLYRGQSVLILFSVPKVAARFGANEYLKQHYFTDKNNRYHTFCAGLGAGIFEAITVVTPSETIKVKLIHDLLLDQPKFRGLIHGCTSISKQYGISGLYKGLVPTILKQGSNQGIRFLVYGDVNKQLQALGCNQIVSSLLASGFAGICSTLANTPVDVIKTNMQGLNAGKYKNWFDCAAHIAKNEGLKGFYKGTVARLSRVVADVAITFTLFEQISKGLNYVWPDKH